MNSVFLLAPVLLTLGLAAVFYLVPMRTRKAQRLFLFFSTLAVSLATWSLILLQPAEGFEVYRFSEKLSIVLKLDGLGVFFAGLTSFLWPFATLYAFEYMRDGRHNRMFFTFYLMTFGVTEGIAFAGNMLTAFVFYEMLTLTTLPLVLSRFNEDSQFAARRYAVYCLGGSAFAFIGVVFLSYYGEGAAFTLGGVLGNASVDKNLMLAVFLISFFGFGVKAAVFPFHAWLPMASVAPTPVTALLHAVAVVKAGVFLMMRTVYYGFGADYLRGTYAQQIALGFAIFTLVFGAAMALKERHFKRRLAYSTVSNLSYILYGVLLCTDDGFAAGITHTAFHALIKIGAFMCAGAFMRQTGREYLFELDGAGKRMPWTFGFFSVFSMALVGIPLFNGFVSKYQLVMAGFRDGSALGIVGVFALIAAAFLCAVYMFTVPVRAFFPQSGRDKFIGSNVSDPGWRMLVPIGLFAFLSILFGIFTQPDLALAAAIAGGGL